MNSWTARILATLLGACLVVLYVYDINRRGYWEDEIYSARDIGLSSARDTSPDFQLSFSELTYRNDNHPPFYFWLLAQWVRLFGFSEISGRLFSVFFFALGVLALVRFANRWARPPQDTGTMTVANPGLWTLLVFGLCVSCFVMSQEARMYTLAFFLTSLSLTLFIDLVETAGAPRPGRAAKLIALAVVNTLGLYTHYYFLFFYVGEAAVGGLLLLRRRAWKLLPSLVVPGLLFLAWVPQLLRQRERKYESALWVIGPQDGRSYLGMLWEDGGAALSRLLFGSVFQIKTIALILLIAVLVHALLRWRRAILKGEALLLAAVALASYGALLSNDLFHHTITLTRPKYLFFLLPPLLLLFIRVVLWNLPVIRFCALALFIAYNVVGIGRERLMQQHPDWRAIAAQAEKATAGKPLIVRDDDYFLCLSYYYDQRDIQRVVTEEWVSVLPEDFWFLALYPAWKPEIQEEIDKLNEGFDQVERIDVDRFSVLLHFRVRPPAATGPQPSPNPGSPGSAGSERTPPRRVDRG
jgi:uncharacterized membrane protein